MSSRVVLQSAFVIHARPYLDSSCLIELFTLHHGRLTVVARGVRSARSRLRSMLLPFTPLLVSWSGKTDLPTVSKVETNGLAYNLSGIALLSGLYLNELLMRLLPRGDAHPKVFCAYQQVLSDLQNNKNLQLGLRLFEKKLLSDIGYGLQLNCDSGGANIVADAKYAFEFGVGFTRIKQEHSGNINLIIANEFLGQSLLAFHSEQLVAAAEFNDAKRLMRLVLKSVLGDKPLKSRELFAVSIADLEH